MLDRATLLSNCNPQLWREAKERLKRRNLLVTTSASLLAQFMLFRVFSHPVELDADWQFHLFHALTWIGMLLLLLLGCYLLVKNLIWEARRGTLMFLQLTPAPASQILWGKLLGVPILLYWAIALAIPLHLWAAISGGVSLQILAAVYGISAIICGFVYCFTLTYALGWQTGAQTWYIVVLVSFLYLLLFGLWQGWAVVDHASDQVLFSWIGGGISLVLGIPIVPLWKMAVDRFHHPPRLFVLPRRDR